MSSVAHRPSDHHRPSDRHWFDRHRSDRRWHAADLSIVPLVLAAVALLPASLYGQIWSSTGPEGGYVQVLERSPFDARQLLVGTTGGLYSSPDGGSSWQLQSPGLTAANGISNIAPAVLVFDPDNANIVYAGALGSFSFSDGVFRSTDGGAHWLGRGLRQHDVHSLAVDPDRPTTLYAGTERGVYRSDDSGAGWTLKTEGLEIPATSPTWAVSAIAIDPTATSMVYAGLSPFSVSKSTDGGDSWTSINGANLPVGGGGVNALQVDPENPSIVYVAANNTGLYRSLDGGASWRLMLTVHEAGVIRDVRLEERTLYAAGSDLFRSTNHGRSWSNLSVSLPSFFTPTSFAVRPGDPATILVGDGQGRGIFRTTDGGLQWLASNKGLHSTDVHDLVARGHVAYLASARGLFRSTDAGRTWSGLTGLLGWVPTTLALDPTTTATVYVGTLLGVFKSTDGGTTWTASNVGARTLIRALAVDPNDPTVLYAGAQDNSPLAGGIFKSTNAGASWVRSSDGLDDLNIGALAVADSSTIYSGSFGGAGVFSSDDGGGHWQARNNGLPVGRFGRSIADLAVHPEDPAIVYAATPGHGVYKSVDGGANWLAANTGLGELTIQALAIDPDAPATLYAGSAFFGVYRSNDGVATWQELSNGLSQRSITALAIGGPEVLLSGTDAGGVYRHQFCSSSTSLCLNQERFRVEVEWTDSQGASGPGRVVPRGANDSGLFWFFDENNWEMLVKVLDGCAVNGHYWLFSAATTDVEYTLRVTDTQTQQVRTYHNLLGEAAPATTDTAAFATCP